MPKRSREAPKSPEPEPELDPHEQAVNDVAWAPNMGRSYHLIASAGQDHKLKVRARVRDRVLVRVRMRMRVRFRVWFGVCVSDLATQAGVSAGLGRE